MRATIPALVLAFALPAAAAPALTADQILQRTYDNYRAQSSATTVSMTIHRPAWARHLTLSAWTRGQDDALVRFTAPPMDAGNATLKLGQDTWLYNPKLNQVIKLPASMMSQSWMGSDFSYNDLAKSEEIITDYTHKLIGTEAAGGHTVWTIESDPKPGAPVVWGKVVAKVRDDFVVIDETYYDQDGKPARRMVADKVGPLAGRAYPLSMVMSPLDQPGQWTRIETSAARFNIGVPPYLFTLSNLQNPRQ
jgi:outer membrane lipoprotein-sorting protein